MLAKQANLRMTLGHIVPFAAMGHEKIVTCCAPAVELIVFVPHESQSPRDAITKRSNTMTTGIGRLRRTVLPAMYLLLGI